jgi:hypothetical protein
VYGDKRNRRDSDYIIDIPAFSNLEWNWAMEKRWTSSSHKMYQEWALKTESAYSKYKKEGIRRWLTMKAFTGDPLHLSLLCKSKSLFIDNSRLISTFRESPSFVQDASLLLHAAADWPEGLRILLAKGHSTRTLHYSGTFGSSGYSALDCAIELQNLASIKLLLDSDIQPTTLTWFLAVAFLSTSDMCTRSKIISEIAHWLWKRTQFYPSSSFRSPFTREGYGSWYHEYEMDTEAADALYSAGFIDIDIQASDVNVSLGTPLWSQALRLRSSRPKRTLDLLHWFIDKGAQMDIAHPKYGTSPTHIIAERSVYIHLEHIFERSHTSRIGSVELERLERLLHLSLECTIPDRCVCFCAVSGCTSITAALKTTRKADYGLDEFRWSGRNFGLINIEAKRTVIQRMELGGFLQHVNTKRAAIRLLTFDQLELTHTCHNHGHSKYYCYPKDPLSPDEISDIHYSERNDIDLFQQLLADFDSAVFEQTGTLLEFIDGYWMKRMTQIMSEKCTARPNELDTVLREVGVALVPEQEPPQEETLLPLTYEKFVWHVEKIVKDAQDL